jgi:hypothetical protein
MSWMRGGPRIVFLLFAGVAGLGALTARLMMETRGRRLEEIAP